MCIMYIRLWWWWWWEGGGGIFIENIFLNDILNTSLYDSTKVKHIFFKISIINIYT